MEHYLTCFARARACVCARVCARVCVCVCARVRVYMGFSVCVCRCKAVQQRITSSHVAFCYVMLGSDWPKHALLSHAPQGRTLAHLLGETIPEFPTAVRKVIPLFVHSSWGQSLSGIGLSCPGAIIKSDRPINVSSWRANLVQAYVSSLGRNIDRPIPLNCQSWLW